MTNEQQPADQGRGVGALARAQNYLADCAALNITDQLREKWEGFALIEELVAALSLPRQSEAAQGVNDARHYSAALARAIPHLPTQKLRDEFAKELYTTHQPAAQEDGINVRMLNMLKQVRERGFTQATLDNLDRVIADAQADTTPAAHGVGEE